MINSFPFVGSIVVKFVEKNIKSDKVWDKVFDED
jgi:hypothetical protein